MKRMLSVVLAAFLMLTLNAVQALAEEPEVSPNPDLPREAAVILDNVGAVCKVYDLGERVEVEKEQDGFYVLKDGTLVEKWLVRLNTEEAPAERTAYIKNSGETPIYDNPYCEGRPLRMLKLNQAVTVQDEFGKILRVMIEEEAADQGVPDKDLSADNDGSTVTPAQDTASEAKAPEKIQIIGYLPAVNTKNSIGYGYDYGGGGGGGGSGSGEGADGGEISLTDYYVSPKQEGYVLLASAQADAEKQEAFVGGPAKILAGGTEGYACLLHRGDEVSVLNLRDDVRNETYETAGDGKTTPKTDASDKTAGNAAEQGGTAAGNETEEPVAISTVLLKDGSTAEIPTKLLFFKGDKVYQTWTGYAKNNAMFYRNWRTQLDDPKKLAINTELQVVGEFGEYNIVQLEDETVGLLLAGMLSETKVAYGYDYSGGGGGGGGGGSEWTEPTL